MSLVIHQSISSPWSLYAFVRPVSTHRRLLREGSAIGSLRDCLRLEWRLACQCLLNGESDFPEGVAAALIRKDRAPAWRYRWPEGTRNSGLAAWQAAGCEEAVPSAAVDAMFAPLRADVPRPQYLFAEEARPRL